MSNLKIERRRTLPKKAVIGMIHTLALPGSVGYVGDFSQVLNRALYDLQIYLKAKVDAVIIENMADVPYMKSPLDVATTDGMFLIAKEVRKRTDIPIGIQMLEAANCEAMVIAGEAGLDFIRAEGFVYAHIGGAGIIEGSARKILKIRKKYTQSIQVFVDIKKKHCAHALTADLTIADIAKQSDFFCANGLIVTGGFTGEPVGFDDLSAVKNSTKLPVLIGSGITGKNFNQYFDFADGFIVGTYFKEDCDWRKPPVAEKVEEIVKKRRILCRN